MEKGKGRPDTGRSSTDILSRIRETAASKPEHQIRHLTEENRRLVYELGIAQVDLARLQGEQGQLVEAYGVLEKRHDDDVRRLSKELEDSILASVALEKERDSLKLKALDFQSQEELKDVANKTTRSSSGAVQAQSTTDGSALPSQSTHARASGHSPMQGPKDEIRQLNEQLAKAYKEIQTYRYNYDSLARAFEHEKSERHKSKEATAGMEKELLVLRREVKNAQNLAGVRGEDPVAANANASFTKADSVSLPEVIAKASQLNEEISQAATLLGESLAFEQAKEMAPKEMKQWTDYCANILGPKVTEILINEAKKEGAHEVNQFLVQVFVQIFLVRFCQGLIEFWNPDDAQYSEFLEKKVYKSIRNSGELLSLDYLHAVVDGFYFRRASGFWPLEGFDSQTHPTGHQ